MSTQELDAVLADPRVWRGRRVAGAAPGLPSGFAVLDAALPEGGFPADALTEVHSALTGIGELSLLLPVLAERSRRGLVAFISPPHIPYAPALAAAGFDLARLLVVRTSSPRETCWAMEQALRDGACGAVVGWLDQQRCAFATLRRLQLAAETGGSFGVAFRAWGASLRTRRSVEHSTASPAALRLALSVGQGGLRVTVLKCRGRAGRFAMELAADASAAARDRSRPRTR